MRNIQTLSALLIVSLLALVAPPAPAAAQPTLSQVQKLLASGGEAGDQAGTSVAISGNTAVIGAPFHNDEESNQGAAWVYQRDPAANTWSQVKQLLASDAGFDNFFGTSVAISGDRIAVGAPGNDIAFNLDQGSAYVFERDAGGPGNWGQVAEPIAASGATSEDFGSAVAIDGNTLIVGAPRLDIGNGGFFVYTRDAGGAWLETGRIDTSEAEFADRFGAALAIHGDTIVVGSPEAPSGGKAAVFTRDAADEDGWSFVAELVRTPVRSLALYGGAVAVHGDTAVVGARDDDVGFNLEQGAVYVFGRDQGGTNAWGLVARVTASDGTEEDGLGAGVALRGDLLIASTRSVFPAPPVYSFGRNQGGTNAWGELQRLTSSDGAPLGPAVALTGGVFFGFDAVIGAPSDDVGLTNVGSAYVFGNTRALPIIDAVIEPIAGDGGQLRIGSVEDGEQSPATLIARIDGGTSATTNGVTVANLVIADDGDVLADVDVACGASEASFELSFTDEGGLVALATLTIEVTPSDPPVLQLGGPVALGSPNHKYRTLSVGPLVASALDDCDGDLSAQVVIGAITSDEPDDVAGGSDGNSLDDAVIVDCRTLRLRAERDELRNGRVYGIGLRVTDSEGSATSAVFPVRAPVESKGPALDDGPVSGVTSTCP